MKFKVIDQYGFSYCEGDLSYCTSYYNIYKAMWQEEGKFLTIELEE